MTVPAGPAGYDAALGRQKPAKGERAAVLRYLEDDEAVHARHVGSAVRETGPERVLFDGTVVVLVTDRKLVLGRGSGGIRPRWEVITLPFGHLEPDVSVDSGSGAAVRVPGSGRRSWAVDLPDAESAGRLAEVLRTALAAYRRERMGLTD
ncbi:hypothetical protein [Nakamurella endophytica]|uniref:PH domain-containing protein n=1 Tax=Nakamurella endophytica TaxID=1748367 RepID=A0A917WBV4_9ACTN|nr:hypothetical protein [Nakamurella endophytica]GGL92630.1 hypothetical protein GCM10011594_10480 [Nakamurella endophytica]